MTEILRDTVRADASTREMAGVLYKTVEREADER